MVSRPNLDDAVDKLRWAKHHFDALREQVEPFQQRDTHTFSVRIDQDAGEYIFWVHSLEPTDPDWGLIVGDCVHNARTALDYLIVRLCALVYGRHPRDIDDIQFPIVKHPDRFLGVRGIAEAMKSPFLKSYLTRIEELQPYNYGNIAIWGITDHGLPLMHSLPQALLRLATLDNIDKHRIINTIRHGVDFYQAFGRSSVWPPEFKDFAGTTTGAPLEDGAEIGRWRFQTPLPFEWKPDQVEMKRAFPIMTTLDESPTLAGVLEILEFCIWGVESTFALFEPVFTRLHPPLPVTSIPNRE
jgi:hypothetical protein